MKNTKVISAFPACGKSYMFNKYKDNEFIKILDSDSSGFHWCYDENNNKSCRVRGYQGVIDMIGYGTFETISSAIYRNSKFTKGIFEGYKVRKIENKTKPFTVNI